MDRRESTQLTRPTGTLAVRTVARFKASILQRCWQPHSAHPIIEDDADNLKFCHDGYLHKPLLSQQEIDDLLELISTVYPINATTEGVVAPGLYSSYAAGNADLRQRVDNEVRAVMEKYVASLLRNYKILTCGVFIKAPGGGVFGLHYHWTVLEDYSKYVINIWCPLQPTSVESGTLHVLPQTHKITPEVVSASYSACYASYEEYLRGKYSVPMECQPGEAVVFDITLHHWSTPNTKDQPRIAIHCNCIPAEDDPIYVYFDEAHPERFEAYRTNMEFYVRDLHVQASGHISRPTNLPFLGYLPNINKAYTCDEYEELLSRASEVRETVMNQRMAAILPTDGN
jgi:Phytanoyl-CoA dioxygenase (PhyH)